MFHQHPAWPVTRDVFHRLTQIVGKVRLSVTPWVNHSWHVPLYVDVRGLTTGLMHHPDGSVFEIGFDLRAATCELRTPERKPVALRLPGYTVASFYVDLMDQLRGAGLSVDIHERPNEIPDDVPFPSDDRGACDEGALAGFAEALIIAHRQLTAFRAPFTGKVSPVHFFWGSFDLAVTRFSGRGAPEHPGGIPNLPDWITREAYSEEVSSAGFWPGDDEHAPLYYSYAYPEPAGFAAAEMEDAAAEYDGNLGEWVLRYAAVANTKRRDERLATFFRDTYDAAARLAEWPDLERAAPEQSRGRWL